MAKKSEGAAAEIPKPAGGPIVNLIEVVKNFKALVAAYKVGNWFGDGGVLDMVAALVGAIGQAGAGSDTGPAVVGAFGDSEGCTPADLEATLSEFKSLRASGACPLPLPAAGTAPHVAGFDPTLFLNVLTVVENGVSWFLNYWKSTHTS
jgi:hypothetical protein